MSIDRNQSGIASEFFVAGELYRRNYDIALSFGATKTFDIVARKDNKTIAIQIKGMQSTKNVNWLIDKTKVLSMDSMFIVLVNLHIDKLETEPEYFVFTIKEILPLIIDKNKNGDFVKPNYIPYTKISRKRKEFQNRWDKIEDFVTS